VDKLFDRHWISFDSAGELIWQHEAAGEASSYIDKPAIHR
jgi:putative restriction endonuclease